MNIREFFFLALSSLKTNKFRSFLTILGVVIGITTIITIVSLIQGLNRAVARQILDIGSGVITVAKYSIKEFGTLEMEDIRDRKDLTVDDASAIERLYTVDDVAPSIVLSNRQIEYGGKKVRHTTVIGTTPTAFDIRDHPVVDGRAILDVDVIHAQRVVCIGDYIADELFGNQDPLGENIKIDQYKFRIIGILEEKGSVLGTNLDNRMIIPLSVAEELFPPVGPFDALHIEVRVKDPRRMERAVDEIRALLRHRRGVSFDEPDDFGIDTPEMLMELYEGITRVAFLVMIGISSIALIVGGIGIMNIMLVSVTERTREIGIRRAIGAKKQDILCQFLIEAVVLSLVGGIIGIILGFSIARLVASVSPLPAVVSWWTVILGFTFSSLVGIFFGIYPARKAANLSPVEALRYE